MLRSMFLVLMVFFSNLHAKDYLSVCAIFQDEAPYLKEWIEYHRLMGAEHFYLYDNDSHDEYLEVLLPYINKKIVTLIYWPSSREEDWTSHQIRAYNDCVAKVKNKTKWLAVIDIDEFIVPVKAKNLTKLLKNYEGAGGVQFFWQFFGTSYVYEIPEDKTLIETLVMKAPKDYIGNYNFKTICQPKTVKQFHVHGAEYHHPWHEIFPHGTRGGAHQPIHIEIARCHHYWTRDEKYFREKKIARRERLESAPISEERIQATINDLDQEVDDTILRFVPALRKKLNY